MTFGTLKNWPSVSGASRTFSSGRPGLTVSSRSTFFKVLCSPSAGVRHVNPLQLLDIREDRRELPGIFLQMLIIQGQTPQFRHMTTCSTVSSSDIPERFYARQGKLQGRGNPDCMPKMTDEFILHMQVSCI